MATWMRRAGIEIEREVEGMSSDNNKRPDIVFWHQYKQHVVDVTVTDPLNATNTRRVGSIPSHLTDTAVQQHANAFDAITEIIEKRKNKHYQQLVQENDAVFHTAAAFTTGKLGKEFRQLHDLISSIAQEEHGGIDPAEIVEGMRGSVAVAIQVGNAMVIHQSWVALAKRNMSTLMRPCDIHMGRKPGTSATEQAHKQDRARTPASMSSPHSAYTPTQAPAKPTAPAQVLSNQSRPASSRSATSASTSTLAPTVSAAVPVRTVTPTTVLVPARARTATSVAVSCSASVRSTDFSLQLHTIRAQQLTPPSSALVARQRPSTRRRLFPAEQDLNYSTSDSDDVDVDRSRRRPKIPRVRVLNETSRRPGEKLKIQTRRGYVKQRAEAIQGVWIEDGDSESEGG
jgi:uncharacterized protein YdbL (DUF1318 family)